MNVLKNCNNANLFYAAIKKIKQYLFVTLLLSISVNLNAAEKIIASTNAIGISEYLKVLLGLVFVIGLFFVSTYLYKRYGHGAMPGRGQLRIIDGLHLGNRERLVLVEFKNKQVLLAVTPGQIQKLDTINAPGDIEESFDDVLEQANESSQANQTQEVKMSNA